MRGDCLLLEPLKNRDSTTKRIWEAIQTLFPVMNEVQELVAFWLRSKTRVVFSSSPGYATCFTIRLRHVSSDCRGERMADADGGPKS